MTRSIHGPDIFRLAYADTPPSMNTNVGKGHWRNFQGAKKRWEGIFAMLLLKEHVPRNSARVSANVMLRFPSKRKRDEGNYRTIIEKALGDALQVVRVIPDDSPEFYEVGQVTFAEDKGPALTEVTLYVWSP